MIFSRRKSILSGISICSVISGVLLTLGWTLNINRDSLIGAFLVLFGYVLQIFSFLSIYYLFFDKIRPSGSIATCFIVLANALFTPWVFLDIARLTQVIPDFNWQIPQEQSYTHILGVIGGFSFIIGYILFGIEIIRVKLVNKLVGLLLIIAAIAPLFYQWIPIGKLLPRIAGLSLIIFGFDVLFKFEKYLLQIK